MIDRLALRAVAVRLIGSVLCAASFTLPAHADELGHRPTVWSRAQFAGHREKAMAFGDAYRRFLGQHKTEHEVAAAAQAMAAKRGFRDLLAASRPRLGPGARVYAAVHGKQVALVVIGQQPLTAGVHVVAAHIDAVRIDLKQNPVYGAANAAWLQTHYYGGIKRYQWLSIPLELRGVVVKKSGERVRVAIGDDPDEPVLVIPDVAVHVARGIDRAEGEEVPGEALDPIVAATPLARGGRRGRGGRGTATRDPFAAEAERLLAQRHGIAAEDLASAELQLVPAGAPRDVGVDRALVGGYGHDDRACAYAALRAVFALRTPRHTAVVMLVDKEEVGSIGNTGARSSFFRRVVAELVEGTGGSATELVVDRVLAASTVISADVTGAVNAQYADLYEVSSAAFLGSGVVWDNTTAHAELLAYLRALLDRAKIAHQPSRWATRQRRSRSTVLPFFTRHGMSGLDLSIPILSMHAPFEVVSKADLYEAYRAYRVFLAD